MAMAASSVLQVRGITRHEFGLAKARTRFAANDTVVELVGESGGRLVGVSCVGIDERNDGDTRSAGHIF